MKNDLGFRIKEIRNKLGLTMEEFGKMFTPIASKGVVSNWENGYNRPNNNRLHKIAELGEMSINELIYGDERTYVTPFVISIAKRYYDLDLNNDPDTVNHIINRIDCSFCHDESSLYSDNKDVFDNLLLYPWEWDSEGFIQFTSIKLFELSKTINEFHQNSKDNFDIETQTDISKTLLKIIKEIEITKNNIENLPIDEKFTSEARIKNEIKENANKIILDPGPFSQDN